MGDHSCRNGAEGPIIGGPFTLVDTANRIVTERNLRGNWLLLYYGYTSSPDIGPEQVQVMAEALNILGLALNLCHFPITYYDLVTYILNYIME